MTAPQTIAVLGLGRMGSAIATRLTRLARLADGGHDWGVVGWTRSGRTTSTGAVETVGDVSAAVAKADVVVLALFDGHACRQVVDQLSDALRPEAIVWNASTVAPAEASELARRLGRSYVHAPVLGSVPAVAAGELEILAAGDQDALERARPVLEALGKVHRVEDAATAAALKLVANSSLAGAVLALRETLRQAEALGLRRAQVLDVLELGQLGGLVARKRAFLAGPLTAAAGRMKTDARQTTAEVGQAVSDSAADAAPGAAEFTIGALAKDMALLAEASHSPLGSAAELAGTPADPSADIAVAATVPSVDDAVLEPLRAYMRGHATGDPAHFRAAFLASAHIEGIRDGAFVSWRLDEYCDLFNGLPAADEAKRSRRIDAVSVHGSVATASMTLWHGADIFTDIFLLVHVDGRWRIANKAYHRATNRAAVAGSES